MTSQVPLALNVRDILTCFPSKREKDIKDTSVAKHLPWKEEHSAPSKDSGQPRGLRSPWPRDFNHPSPISIHPWQAQPGPQLSQGDAPNTPSNLHPPLLPFLDLRRKRGLFSLPPTSKCLLLAFIMAPASSAINSCFFIVCLPRH